MDGPAGAVRIAGDVVVRWLDLDVLKVLGLVGFPLDALVVLFFVLRRQRRGGLAENEEVQNDDLTD